MTYKKLTPEARIKFAQLIVTMGNHMGLLVRMDDATAWLMEHGEFTIWQESENETEYKFSADCRDKLNTWIRTL